MVKILKILCLVLFLSYSNSYSQSETSKVELIDLIKELIITKKDGENMTQIWWFPTIYWELSLKDSNYVNTAMVDEVKSTLNDYNMFVVVDVTISPLSGLKKNKIDSITMNINNTRYKPLENIPDGVTTVVESLKPTLSRMLGQMGKSIEIFIFDNTHENRISPFETGRFSILENGNQFEYSLPLSSLVEKKTCPIDNKLLSGNWIYCPWHGEKLLTK